MRDAVPVVELSYIAISELQPLSVEDRKIHDARIAAIQQEREERLRRSIKQEEEREGGGEEATPAAAVVEEQTVLVEDL